MEFAARPSASLGTGKVLRWGPGEAQAQTPSSTTAVAVAPSVLARSVLPRVLTVLAARAGFTTDRISDVQLVADARAAQARDGGGDEHVRLTARVARRRIELAVGPLSEGSARKLVEAADAEGVGSVIGKLSDEHRIDGVPDAPDATLLLALADRV
jgi:hypothetical protein